ncbi:MAG: asparagine synthetase B family protein [Leptolyngbyaceae cyanobacterium bins.59]|nr:asparagine synthetase B family protein [Leptolyngbyaceae cyanobacterium bins.59]
MKGMLPATISLRPHRFVGYWGSGLPSELTQRFNRLLEQVQVAPFCVRSGDAINLGQKTSFTLGWEVAYLELEQVPPLPKTEEREMIAAGSVAGLLSNGQGDELLDAWVCLQSNHPNHQLTLGRNSFGRFPLYWLQSGTVLWFASHLQLLVPLCPEPSIQVAALYGYSCFSYVPTPLTPIAAIAALPAGTEQTWELDRETGQIRRSATRSLPSWTYALEQIDQEQEAIDSLQRLLKQAITRQIGDLGRDPVGVFLSGGLDSAIVAALLVQAGVSVRAYTLEFGSAGISEVPYAAQVAQFLQIPLIRVKVTPQQVRKALIPTVRALDLPFGDGVTVPLFLLAEAASQEVRVVFNGEGGDQLFAGWTNKPMIAASLYKGLTSIPEADLLMQQYLQTFHRLYGYESQVFQSAFREQLMTVPVQSWLTSALDGCEDHPFLDRLRRANLILKGAQNIQPRATYLAAAHGLQLRSPFCDPTLAQWTFQIAGSLFLQGSCEKYILKRAVENWLPAEVVWRSKRGMGVPLTNWCQKGLWSDLGHWLNPGRLRQEGIWQPNLATRIVMGQLGMIQGRRIGEILWLLLIWQVWRETIAGQKTSADTWDHPFWCPRSIAVPSLRWYQRTRSG